MKNPTKKEKRWKYLLFSCIGILSFLIGEYWREKIFHIGIDGTSEIYFTLLIYFILFGIGLYVAKEYSLVFILRAFVVSFIMLTLIFGGFFVWSAHEHYYAKSIHIHKLHETPAEYVNITEEELKKYPALRKVISGEGCTKSNDSWYLKVHPDEWKRTIDFIREKGTNVIKVKEQYYEVGFITA